MTAQQLLLVAACFYAVVLAAVTYFTRATKRRFLGALVGGLAVAVVGVGIEVLFQTLGFWHYPSADQPYGPALMYPVVVPMWAVLALIGWRVTRRFGWRGQRSIAPSLAPSRASKAAGQILPIEDVRASSSISSLMSMASLWWGI